MAYENTIKKFLGQGVASERPASLNLEPGAVGIYYAKDTNAFSFWTGVWSSWVSAASYTDEQAQDAAAAMISAGAHSGISFSYDDAAGALSATVSASSAYTDEQARDVVAAMFAAGTHSGVAFTYDDASDSMSVTATPPSASVQSLTSASTITPAATNDLVSVSALAVNATIANPTGTAAAGQGFVITIKDDGTARTLTWGSNYVGMDGAPVATTTAGKLVDIPVRYSAILSKWLVYKPSVQA